MKRKAEHHPFTRESFSVLSKRLKEPRRFIQVVAGARQTGKTTLVRQVLDGIDLPSLFVSADEPTLRDSSWLHTQWENARLIAKEAGRRGAVLAVDEAQKIAGWSETVKRLWDEDTRAGLSLKAILLGSAPLLMQRGLSESLAGRFEVLRLPHWSFTEMSAAFDFSLSQYLYFGGYPGAAALAADPDRWRRYILDSLIETTISRDVLLLARVDKPALLRRVFELGCHYSGQVLSFTKMIGQLQDAGNTTTIAHYLDLLSGAGMLTGISKYAAQPARQRSSSPKLQVMNTALLTSLSGLSPVEAEKDGNFWGRLVESSVGAHLANAASTGECDLFYWRERNREVDFVLRAGRVLVAIEVKSGRRRDALSGLAAFTETFKPNSTLLVGADGIPLERFLSQPVSYWLGNQTSSEVRD
jgi:uncharacterized protein